MISGHSRKIKLRSGGTLVVHLEDVEIFKLDAAERAFLASIVDAMHEYEVNTRLNSSEQPAAPQETTDGK